MHIESTEFSQGCQEHLIGKENSLHKLLWETGYPHTKK